MTNKHGKRRFSTPTRGSQFTGAAFTGLLIKNGIAISMDGEMRGETTPSSSGCGAASNTIVADFGCGQLYP